MVMKFNGKPFRPGDLERAINKAAKELVVKHVRDTVGPLRDPDTDQFVTVAVDGSDLHSLAISVEGSAQVMERVRENLELQPNISAESEAGDAVMAEPHVFLSFGWEDHALAERIATQLIEAGVQTWWSEWEIRAGDSLRRKIDAGIGGCTHFVVLLTPTSITRPWVQEEVDAAFARKMGEGISLISLRHNVDMSHVPPLLAGSLCPLIGEETNAIKQLVNDILGISRKPSLGNRPIAAGLPKSNYSQAAMAVAKVFVEGSPFGTLNDHALSDEDLQSQTGLTKDDLTDALFELKRWVEARFGTVFAREGLYAEFDAFWMDWKPVDDAALLASQLMNDPKFPHEPERISERLGWPPRRLNPAVTYLEKREIVRTLRGLGTGQYMVFTIEPTDDTRRFLRGRNAPGQN